MITRADITMIRSLADKKERAARGLFVVEGRKMVGEALASGWEVRHVYTTDPGPDYGPTPVTLLGPAQLERISRLKTPQGVLALVIVPEPAEPDLTPGKLILALDGVQDPGNLGTIIRIADWFGVQDILCSGDTADRFNPKVVQASMGSLFRVRVHYGELERCLEKAAHNKIPVYGAFLNGENIYSAGELPPGVVVMGNEGNGISHGIEKLIGRRISIPSFAGGGAGAESLNVAVATAVITAEIRRRGV